MFFLPRRVCFELKTHHFLLVSILFLFLLILYAFLIWFTISIQFKNKQLVHSSEETLRVKRAAEHLLLSLKKDKLSPEQTLFKELVEQMRHKKLFTDPELDREKLAKKLGTNRTYLTKAVKMMTDGQSVRDYINYNRLHYAAELLTKTDLPVTTIVEHSGFKTSSKLYRYFKEYFGMHCRFA